MFNYKYEIRGLEENVDKMMDSRDFSLSFHSCDAGPWCSYSLVFNQSTYTYEIPLAGEPASALDSDNPFIGGGRRASRSTETKKNRLPPPGGVFCCCSVHCPLVSSQFVSHLQKGRRERKRILKKRRGKKKYIAHSNPREQSFNCCCFSFMIHPVYAGGRFRASSFLSIATIMPRRRTTWGSCCNQTLSGRRNLKEMFFFYSAYLRKQLLKHGSIRVSMENVQVMTCVSYCLREGKKDIVRRK